jgi:GNAT superfamily N-acetyltransferase
MSEIVVKLLQQSDIKTFLKFAFKIYKNDPNWVPPLYIDKKKILNKKKNPFFNDAELDMFMAYRDGEPVGRIAAIKNNAHNRIHNENIGFFGFFECINDQEVANKLFDTAKEWIKQRGLDTMRGPASPSSNDEYALLIEGFDEPPKFMMPYNPTYYIDLIENYGMKKAKDLYAYIISQTKMRQSEKLIRVQEIARKRSGIKLRSINMKEFKKELELVKYVYNKAWAPNWGFVPMTDAEIDALAKDLKPIVEPSLVLFGEIEGQTVGFALVMPDYNKLFRTFKGRLFPFNFIKLFTQKRTIDCARVITLGMIPEFQKKGLDGVFYAEIMDRAREIGIEYGEASWILEDNEMMKRGAEVMRGELYKKYRVYDFKI